MNDKETQEYDERETNFIYFSRHLAERYAQNNSQMIPPNNINPYSTQTLPNSQNILSPIFSRNSPNTNITSTPSQAALYTPGNKTTVTTPQLHSFQSQVLNIPTQQTQQFNYSEHDPEADYNMLTQDVNPPSPSVCTAAPPIKKAKGRKGINQEKQWSNDETEALISLWFSKEILYNSSLPEYMDKDKKQVALKEIADELNVPENIIQKKMNSLRTYYGSLRQAYKNSSKSGSGANEVKKPSWPWYDMLAFLEDNLRPRETTSNLKKTVSQVSSKMSSKSSKTNSANLQNDFLVQQTNLMATAANVLAQPPPETVNIVDKSEDTLFGELIGKSISKLPDGDIKEELKIEIQSSILFAKRKQAAQEV